MPLSWYDCNWSSISGQDFLGAPTNEATMKVDNKKSREKNTLRSMTYERNFTASKMTLVCHRP